MEKGKGEKIKGWEQETLSARNSFLNLTICTNYKYIDNTCNFFHNAYENK